MDFKKIFKYNKRNNGLNYVSSYSDALCFSPYTNGCSSMNLSAVYRATEIISDSIAMLPVKIQNVENIGKSEVTYHPLKDVFGAKNQLNNLSKYTFMKMLIQSVILRGNGFAYIERGNDGTVLSLRFLETNDVIINYNKYNNQLYYQIPILKGKTLNVEPIDIIHLVKNSYDGINGISVLSYASRTISTANSTEESAKSFFQNGMNLSGVLTVQGQLQEKQKQDIRSSWAQAYANGGQGLAVLQGNMSYQPIQINAKDAQMIESRQFNVQDIARFFGISPVLLGDLQYTSYNTIEAVQNEFLLHTLQPYITMIEDEFNRKLLKPSERNLNIILETNEILRVDKSAQSGYYASMISNGIMSINEVRKELGLTAIEGGDKHIIPYTDVNQNTVNKEENNNI